tara:strand:- start:1622 stop:1891 length:270 start_codon:yes stop_codon:yes gene_type:complete
MPDPIAIANEAAKHDDRWLFIALLVIGLIAVWMIVKYFMAQIQVLSQRIDAIHTEYQGYLREQNQHLSKIIAENTAILHRVEQRIPLPA